RHSICRMDLEKLLVGLSKSLATTSDFPPLCEAAHAGDIKGLEFFLKGGEDINEGLEMNYRHCQVLVFFLQECEKVARLRCLSRAKTVMPKWLTGSSSTRQT